MAPRAGDPAGHVLVYVLQLVPLWAVCVELCSPATPSGASLPPPAPLSGGGDGGGLVPAGGVPHPATPAPALASPSSSEDEGGSEKERVGLLGGGGGPPLASPPPHAALSVAPTSPWGSPSAAPPDPLLALLSAALPGPLLPLPPAVRATLAAAEALVLYGTFTTVAFFHLPSEVAAALGVGALQAAATATLVRLAHRGPAQAQLVAVWLQRAAACASVLYVASLLAVVGGLVPRWVAGTRAPPPAQLVFGVAFDAGVLATLWLGLLRCSAMEVALRGAVSPRHSGE